MFEFDKVFQRMLTLIDDENLLEIMGDLESAHKESINSIETDYNDKIEAKDQELSNLTAAKELGDDKIKELKAHNYELFSQIPKTVKDSDDIGEETEDISLTEDDPLAALFKEE